VLDQVHGLLLRAAVREGAPEALVYRSSQYLHQSLVSKI